MEAQVLYNGKLIATISEGQSITLHCGGEMLTGDILIFKEETQTLTIINSNNPSETATFTMPSGYTFTKFIGSEYDSSGGDLQIEDEYFEAVFYKGSNLLKSDGSNVNRRMIASGVFYYDGEVQEETTYELSGTWLFNETIEQPAADSYSVDFTSHNPSSGGSVRSYSAITLHINLDGFPDLAYLWDNGITQYIVYDFSTSVWNSDKFRTVTFDGTQTVSEEFYTWFTANAKPTTYELSGTWMLNDVLEQPATNLIQEVSFSSGFRNPDNTSTTTTYSSITFEENSSGYISMLYRGASANTTVAVFGESSSPNFWTKELTFDGIQTVSKEFYEWFTANATKTA